jgi:hypothetical protein
MVSKLLKASSDAIKIGDVLQISSSSPVHNRNFRNHLEHYDKELKKWIRKKGTNKAIGTYNVGPKSALQFPGIVFISHCDPATTTITFVDRDLNLTKLYNEIVRIKALADRWVKGVESGTTKPPFA